MKLAAKHDNVRRSLSSTRGAVSSQIMSGKPGYGDATQVARPANAKADRIAAPSGPPTAEIVSANMGPWGITARLKVKAPKKYGTGDVTYKVSGPCGLDYGGPLESDGSIFGCCYYDETQTEFMALKTQGNWADKWRLGAGPHTVKLTFSASGLPDMTRSFTGVTGAFQQVKISLTVDSVPPFLGANAAGVQASNAKFGGNGPRANDGEPWSSTTGQDTLGMGIFLGKGYKVTDTKILSAHSRLDAPNNTAPENSYRFARVKTKPDADRLQTVVEWMYGPGESLSYTIEWTITGPLGQRALSTMPLSGPCDS